MLVLTRKVGETIVINRDVRLTIIETSRGKVRLAFEAPISVRIVRGEHLANRLRNSVHSRNGGPK